MSERKRVEVEFGKEYKDKFGNICVLNKTDRGPDFVLFIVYSEDGKRIVDIKELSKPIVADIFDIDLDMLINFPK